MVVQQNWPSRALAAAGLVFILSACGSEGPDNSDSAASETPPSAMTGGEMSGSSMTSMMKALGSKTWQGMKVELASADPETFDVFQGDRVKKVAPEADDSVHLMAILSDSKTLERIPYAECWVTIADSKGNIIFDERMWPMMSQGMGTHYGINVPLPQSGNYDVKLRVGPPQAARHPEYSEVWLQAKTFTFPLQNGK
jgi:hypothetical protein